MTERLRRGSPAGSAPHDPVSTARAVNEMFTAVAPRYDFLNHFLSFGTDLLWRRAAAQAVREVLSRTGSVALDVCCGTGDLALAFARYSRGSVLAADFCRPMLVRAGAKAAKRGRRVSLLEADTLALPLPDAAVDLVGVAFGFRNLADYERGLAEMRRVLKPGGIAAILEFSRVRSQVLGPLFGIYFHHILPALGTWISGVRGPYQYLPDSVSKFPDQDELAELMRRHGFQNVRYRNFSAGVAALHLGVVPQPEGQDREARAVTEPTRAEKWL